jgi:hypothetical protein
MTNEAQVTSIKDVRAGQKNLTVVFIVLDIGKPTRTKDGHSVRAVKVADKTGSINMSLWDEVGDLLQTGDICRITKGYGSMWKGCLTLYTGKGGEIHRIGEFCMVFNELPNMSEPNPEYMAKLQEQESKQGSGQRRSPTEQQAVGSAADTLSPGTTLQPPGSSGLLRSTQSNYHPPQGNAVIPQGNYGPPSGSDPQRSRPAAPLVANNGLTTNPPSGPPRGPRHAR